MCSANGFEDMEFESVNTGRKYFIIKGKKNQDNTPVCSYPVQTQSNPMQQSPRRKHFCTTLIPLPLTLAILIKAPKPLRESLPKWDTKTQNT